MKLIFFLFTLLIGVTAFSRNTAKDPIVIEVTTKHQSMDDALQAAKAALLKQKFVATDGIQKSGFTATRTTGSKADYYVADVTVKGESGKIKVTISFIKVGTGLLNLKKVTDAVKEELEK